MKKILVGTAVVAMMLASCTNEEVVNQNADGQMFALKVSMDAGSRTALDGLQTVWSAGDRIYVTSKDGKTTGVLTLKSEPGRPDGTFEGYVFGDGELNYAVYPVPVDGKKDMGKANTDRLDAPMTGDISAGATTFENACGLVKLNVLGVKEGDVVNVSGTGIGSVMKYDLATNSWVQETAGANISVYGVEDATEFFVPVYTTNTTASDVTLQVSVNDGEPADVTIPVAVKSVNTEVPILAVTSDGDVVDPSNASDDELGDDYAYVTEVEDFETAIGQLNGKQGTATYVVVKEGTYNISSSNEIQIRRSMTIVGDGEVTLVAAAGTGYRVINIYGGVHEKDDVIDVKIKNITIEGETGYSKHNITLRSDAHPSEQKAVAGNMKVTLENVTCRDVWMDNWYVEGATMNLELKGCDIKKVAVEAYDANHPSEGDDYHTFSILNYDNDCNVGVYINTSSFQNMLVNGKVPTAIDWFVEYAKSGIE